MGSRQCTDRSRKRSEACTTERKVGEAYGKFQRTMRKEAVFIVEEIEENGRSWSRSQLVVASVHI